MEALSEILNGLESIMKRLKERQIEINKYPSSDQYTIKAIISNLNRANDLIKETNKMIERTGILEEQQKSITESRDTSFDFNVERYLHGEKI